MRRRRPSALYSVLNEEDLLGDVDLPDHPDSFGWSAGDPEPDFERGAGLAEAGRELGDDPDRGEWSPDVEPGWAGDGEDWSPESQSGWDGEDWSPESQSDWAEDRAARSPDQRTAGGPVSSSASRLRRRLRLGVWLVAGTILVVAVARELGGLAAVSGGRSVPRRTDGALSGALPAVSRESGDPRSYPTGRAPGRSDGGSAGAAGAIGPGRGGAPPSAVSRPPSGVPRSASGVGSLAAGASGSASGVRSLAAGASGPASGVGSLAAGASGPASGVGSPAAGAPGPASGVRSPATGVVDPPVHESPGTAPARRGSPDPRSGPNPPVTGSSGRATATRPAAGGLTATREPARLPPTGSPEQEFGFER
jgi:hypothetical protein